MKSGAQEKVSSSCLTSDTRRFTVKRREHHLTWKSCQTSVCVNITANVKQNIIPTGIKTFSPKRQLFHVPIYVLIVEFSILNDDDSDGYHRRYICNHVKLGINCSQVMVTIVHKRFWFLKKKCFKTQSHVGNKHMKNITVGKVVSSRYMIPRSCNYWFNASTWKCKKYAS